MEETYLSSSIFESQEIAKKVLNALKGVNVISLAGPMAAGKTTFTQGLGEVLGIERVVSPTYLIMREYPIENHSQFKKLFHLDLYRLNSPEEIKSFDLGEIWNNSENLVVIEWPESLAELLPKKRIDISFNPTGDNQREIKIITP